MKKLFLVLVTVGTLQTSFAQDLRKSQVPSVVLNQFDTQFSKAYDIEWEKKGDLYKVEFEVGLGNDHDVWYDSEGKMVKHKEELSGRDLPQNIKEYIKKEYKGYRIDDADKITENDQVIYKIEVEKRDAEIVLRFNEEGSLIP